MAYLGHFDATTVTPQAEFTALPSGEYLMAITESDMKDTKSRTGRYLQLTLSVINAAVQEHIGRKVFVRLNLENANQQAVDIAQRELSAICHAVGVLQCQDSQQLHNLPMCCKVQYVPAKGEFNEDNKIVAYKPASDYGKGKPPAAASVMPQPPRPITLTAASVSQSPPRPLAQVPQAPQAPVAPWRAKPASAPTAA